MAVDVEHEPAIDGIEHGEIGSGPPAPSRHTIGEPKRRQSGDMAQGASVSPKSGVAVFPPDSAPSMHHPTVHNGSNPGREQPMGTVSEQPSLVGRHRELEELDAHIGAAMAGNGRLVLVAGEPGLGKSHLLDEVGRRAAAAELAVVSARCWDGQGALPLWVWMQIVRELTDMGLVSDPTLHSLFGDGTPVPGLLGDVDPAGARFRLFDRIVTGLRTSSQLRPLVIVLDDLQWADRSSLELLLQLSANSHTSPLLVIGAYRDTEVQGTFADFATALPSDANRLTLTGLPAEHVAELAGTIPGVVVDDELVETLTRHTAGNPFFVKELMRLLASQGRLSDAAGLPAGVREVLSRRLARLSAPCRRVLNAGAVIGAEFDIDLVASVAGVSRSVVMDLLDEAIDGRIVVERGLNQFGFVHDLFRQAFYEGLGRTHRQQLHLAVGEAIESRHGTELDAHLGELAHHFLASAGIGDPAKAVDYGRRAGDRAAALLAFDEAVDYLQRAVETDPALPPAERARLMVALGDALWRARDIAGARVVLGDAADVARATDDPEMFADAVLAYGGGLGGNQPLASADNTLIALLEEALRWLPPDDSARRCRLLSRLAVELYLTDAASYREALSDEALAMARRLDEPTCLATALYARQIAIFDPDGLHERKVAVEEMLELAARVGDLELALWGHLFRLWVLAEQCTPIAAELSTCADLADQLGLPAYRAEVAMRQAISMMAAGEFDEAERLMAVVEAGQATDLAAGTTRVALDAMVGALKGPYEDLAELVNAILIEQPDKVMWRAALVVVYVELGRFDDARREFEMVAASGFDLPRDGLWLFAMFFLGFTCFALGESDHAAQLHSLMMPHVDKGTVAAFGSMATPFGLLNAACGDFDEALRWLDVGYRRNVAMGNRAYALWTRRERAAVLLTRGEPDDFQEARRILDDVLLEVRTLGFDGFVGRTESLAAIASATVVRAPSDVQCELRRDAHGWTVNFEGTTGGLRHSKGMADIALLLQRPGEAVAAVDLAGVVAASDTGELLDERARSELRARLVELEQEAMDAEDFGDIGRAEKARTERDALVTTLTAAVGLGGRPRRAGSATERARKTVTWRIRSAIKTALDDVPPFGRHLDQSIKTGTFCSYDPDSPRTWTAIHAQPNGDHS